jgi:hypothetical protein
MLFWVENYIFLWICLFWPTSSKNDVFFSITISRGTPVGKPWSMRIAWWLEHASGLWPINVFKSGWLLLKIYKHHNTLGRTIMHSLRSWGSLVNIVSDYRLDDRGSISGRSKWFFPLASMSRPALRPTQPLSQWVPGVKRGRGWVEIRYEYISKQVSRSYTSSPPSVSMTCSGTEKEANVYSQQFHRKLRFISVFIYKYTLYWKVYPSVSYKSLRNLSWKFKMLHWRHIKILRWDKN